MKKKNPALFKIQTLLSVHKPCKNVCISRTMGAELAAATRKNIHVAYCWQQQNKKKQQPSKRFAWSLS